MFPDHQPGWRVIGDRGGEVERAEVLVVVEQIRSVREGPLGWRLRRRRLRQGRDRQDNRDEQDGETAWNTAQISTTVMETGPLAGLSFMMSRCPGRRIWNWSAGFAPAPTRRR